MEDKRFLNHVTLDKGFEINENGVSAIINRMLVEVQNEEDKFIVDELYKKYKEAGVTDLYLFNRQKFEVFLKECLPMWIKDRNNLTQEQIETIITANREEVIKCVIKEIYVQFGKTKDTQMLEKFLRLRFGL